MIWIGGKPTLIKVILILFSYVRYSMNGCYTQATYDSCWHPSGSTHTCYQNNAGTYIGCSESNSSYAHYQLNNDQGAYTYYVSCNCYDRSCCGTDIWGNCDCTYNYQCDSCPQSETINMPVYRRCAWACLSCDGQSNPNYNCQSCRSGYFKWTNQDRCTNYCPTYAIVGIRSTPYWGITSNTRGQYESTGNACDNCDAKCNFCNGPSNAVNSSNCFSCVQDYYLIDDYAQCVLRFKTVGFNPEFPCYYRMCYNVADSCPIFFFPVDQATLNSDAPYNTWSSNSAAIASNNYDNSSVLYRQISNQKVCYFCDKHCQTCDGPYQYDCLTCKRYNYMWSQYSGYCAETCPRGDYTSWIGQFINETTAITVNGTTDRICYRCNTRCRWCRNSPNVCLQCQNGSYLMDLHTECMARYITPNNCSVCTDPAHDMCQYSGFNTDRTCVASCPTYFYFTLYRNYPSNDDQGIGNPRYDNYTKQSVANETYINGTDNAASFREAYRLGTNLCMLCDYRCIKCNGSMNTMCDLCRNGYYKWTNLRVCDNFCPIGQYIGSDLAYPDNQTMCANCDSLCLTCQNSSTNCSSCKGAGYSFSVVAFLYRVNDTLARCQNPCPVSTNNSTQIGYYGSYLTLTCYPCPTPCSNCDISIIRNRYPDISCGSDSLCSQGLICTSCLLGYVVVAGKCIQQNNCRQYSYYVPPAVSTFWSSVNCKCLDGYSSNSYAKCNLRCHISCKTCTGNLSNNCASCETGYTLSSGSCVIDSTKALNSYTWITTSGNTSVDASSLTLSTCGTYSSLFGYEDQDLSASTTTYTPIKYFGYTFTITNLKYYAIRIKMSLLFVDEYNSRGAIYIMRDNNISSPVWSWNFDTKSAYGQNLCGTNKMDYVLFVSADLPTRNRTTQTFYISSNQDILVNSLGGNKIYWGLGGIYVTALACDAACNRCTGPSANECLTCATAGYVAINGTCQCDYLSGYYKQSDGTCSTGCPSGAGWFRDNLTRSCVQPPTTSNCTAPYRFGDSMGTTGFGWCVAQCPATYYASVKGMKCTQDCWASFSQYKFDDGASRSCQDPCPSGYIKDVLNRKCVLKCPATYYFQIQNATSDPTCVSKCPNGWQYDGMQLCVSQCPSGYFQQQTDPSNPANNHNKCVSQCVNAFGDPDTNICTLSCPFPKYADTQKLLCLSTCANSSYFAQVAISNLNRTCVPQCESGQWGNPFTRKCSNYTTDCPDGYYADSHTRMCEANCTTAGQVAENSTKECRTSCLTGFAQWQSRACVKICPTVPKMFAYIPTKQCVYNCDHAANGLYGDAQANRTCVQKCSATPIPTFGKNSTSQCVDKCPDSNEFGDPADIYRRCVKSCSSVPMRYAQSITKLCVLTCPDTYYGQIVTIAINTTSGVCVQACLSPNFGDPESNWCRPTCKWGYYGYPVGNRPCLLKCPRYWFGMNSTTNRLCVNQCDPGYWGDIETSMCYNIKTLCSNDTYADPQKFLCVSAPNCTQLTFADPYTKGCESACSNGYYADDHINTCVPMCSDTYDQYGQWGVCTYTCQVLRFADPQANRTCVRNCSRTPLLLFGVIATRRICVTALNCPTNFFGDNQTLLCVNPCIGLLPFGDPITKQCVSQCPDGYYGDFDTHLCVQICNFTTYHYADNQTGHCTTNCSAGTYGVNASLISGDYIPSCQLDCPNNSYARETDRICVADCGTGLYGDPITRKCYSNPLDCSFGYFANSVSHLCVLPSACQTVSGKHYFAQNETKTCVPTCNNFTYGDTLDWFCYPVCNQTSYGENNTRLCITDCTTYSSYAQNQNNLCVARCSNSPIKHYAEDRYHRCVQAKDCPIYTTVTPNAQTFAQNSTQKCVTTCDANEWADSTTFRCVATCPRGYYKDDISGKNLCSSSCPGQFRFRDNSTGSCVSICPASNKTFGDSNADMCVYTCPDGYFAQPDSDRRCVLVCNDSTWGNKITRVCISQPLTQCPPLTWADNFTQRCEEVCDSGSAYYGYNATKMCVTLCPSPTFAWDGSRVCIDICPARLNDSGYFGDPLTTPRKCYLTCQSTGYYRDIAASRTCVTDCTYNSTYKTYKDPTTWSCEIVCSTYPSVRYADDNLKSCETSCAGSLIKNDLNQSCVSICPSMYDPTTDKCVSSCPSQSTLGPLFANLTNNNNTCIIASSCPNNTYADFDSRACVSVCPPNTYKSGKYCVYVCPNNFFMDQATQSCVKAQFCSSGSFADNQTRSCVSECVGTFGDTTLHRCIDVCYGSKYGDPFTHKCEVNCSQGLMINTLNNTCVASCTIGLYANPTNGSCSTTCPSPYYADNSTMACVSFCSANPMTFASISSTGIRECVSRCDPSKMHDMVNRICINASACPTNTYAYTVNMSCVSFCPGPSYYQLGTACVTNCSSDSTLKYADDFTRKCVSICPSGTYKDTLSYKCVQTCPSSPVQYYISASQNKCTTDCPTGTYADPVQLLCVTQCSLTPRLFAVNNVCVQQCPVSSNTYADPTTGACVPSCPFNYFADKRDRTCKMNCSFLFADSGVSPKSCVSNCSFGLYADELTYKCVGTCPPNYYKHTPTRRCVQFCPYGYYLNTLLSLCVVRANCPSSTPYADNLTHLCTSSCSNKQFGYLATGTTTGGTCVYTCTTGFFSNPRTGKCTTSCPSGLFSNTVNNTCSSTCPYNLFMDSVNNKCVGQCPSANNLYADLYNRSCVTDCDPDKFTFADDLTRNCEETCTGNQYADQATQKCVGSGQCSGLLFSDPHLKKCVQICNNGTYGYLGVCVPDCPTETDDVYASQDGFICVAAEDCPQGTYGDPILHKCVQFCPIQSGTFADADSKKCLADCPSDLFADNLTRTCVDTCPNVSKMYGDTDNNKCVLFCAYPFFADETTNLCKRDCPDGYFADSSSRTCVTLCPEGMYGNNVTNECQPTCPSSPTAYFGLPQTRMCIMYCPNGTYADADNNRQCQTKCIGNIDTFAENTTNKCIYTCLTGYANIRTKQCIAVCTSGYFGYDKVCYENCPSVTPTVYADNQTHRCVTRCPNNTFSDLSSLKCVKICPQGTYGDKENWACTGQCTGIYWGDPSTRTCVITCPRVPALFAKLPERVCVSQCSFGFYADNSTRTCASGCPFGTYADNSTMKCEFSCASKPFMYGQNITNTCVKNCWADRDMYADNMTGTCVYQCSPGTFASLASTPTLRQCVETCPSGYFAVIRTGRCEPGCQPGTFADVLLRVCVLKCSVDPIYYGDPNDNKCKKVCPSNSYGNPLTQQCVHDYQTISTCPPNYFADINSMLCVKNCPMKFDRYADPNTKKCELGCSGGLIADNSTMKCVVMCPEYPSYFANLDSKRCIPFCPSNTFADPITRVCTTNCSGDLYADSSTWRCVSQCPQKPLTFADNTTWSCVPTCPDGYFSDNSTRQCVLSCPRSQKTFARNGTKQCVRVCPSGSFGDVQSGYCVLRCYGGKYSDNSSRLCVSQCPKFPPYYADPTTDECVATCPSLYYAFEDNRTCVRVCPRADLYRQNSTAQCVQKCAYSQGTYADNLTGYCVSRCSVNSWANPVIRVCVEVCPDQPLLYADNSSQSCVIQCPGVTYGQNTTRACVNSCPTGSLSLPQRNLCVRYCPIGYFAYNITQFCFSQCPGVYYGDPSTRSCVLSCPLSQLLYADNSSKLCVSYCPPNSYADKKSISCVPICPDANLAMFEAQTYAADYNNVCVQQCALPYYAYLPTKRCVSVCPNPYYNDLKDHKCKLCPNVCTSCTIYDVCTNCIAGQYLQNGKCVVTCSSGYYANQTSMKCVSSSLCKPYYGVNSTRTCTSACPVGSYANRINYRCDACQLTCLTCSSWTNCLTCDTNISAMYQNYCYRFCEVNDTNANGISQQYYDPTNLTCYNACPNGTYLFVIFCKNCSSPCQTCNEAPTNCTRCLDGLYLQNNNCVAQCSTGYRANTTRNCIYCGQTCGADLTFETNMTQVDGQNTIFITFSDTITLNGDPNDIFALESVSRRRLLAAGYRIIVVDSKTIKIVIEDSSNSSSYTVKIVKPENIQDIYGNLPNKVRDQIQVDLSNTYTSSLSTASSTFSNYFMFLAIICVLTFLFDIQFMKFMQLLFVHYFVVMILPPELAKVLLSFRYSTLNYLPTLYSVPAAVLRENVSGKQFDAIGDYSFLRNAGFIFTPLVVIIALWIILKILSVPEINRFKGLRIWCKQQLDEKFKFAILVQWLNIVFLNTIFFIFIQMRDYQYYDEFSNASLILAHILLVLILLVFAYLAYRVISFFREFPKLSQNLKKATDLLLQQNQFHKLNSSNIFLFEMKKIDLRNLYYPKINNENILPFRNIYKFSFLPLCCIFVTYLRAIILAAILSFGTSTILQMSLCIPLNVACLLYFSRARPFSFKFNKRKVRNYVAIFHEVALIFFEFLMLVLGIMDRDLKTAYEKQKYSNFIIYYLCIVCSISFIYFLFRIGVQVYRRIWMPFTETQIFRVNFPEKYAQIHGAKKEKLVRGIDPRAKQALRTMIKNYKNRKSTLRPNQQDKANPQLPMKYKITYFDRDSSSINSKSSMSKAQRRKMVNEIFHNNEVQLMKQSKLSAPEEFYEQMNGSENNTQAQFEEYQQQIEIKAKDLANYVKNADELLRIKRFRQQQAEEN